MDNINKILKCLKKTPCYVVDDSLLQENLNILKNVQTRTKCKIILALKGFSMYSLFPEIRKYLAGVAASSLDEARLGFEEFKGEVHIESPAYKESEFTEIMQYVSHISFNSFGQWEKFKSLLPKEAKSGLRINPEHSEVKVSIYDPCAPYSRLGIKINDFKGKDLTGITGLHFHNLCELNSDSLERTLKVVEKNFGELIHRMDWVNFGGGHHITRGDYDINLLCDLINNFQKKYNVQVYLEPGEAVALNTGFLASSVLDIVKNDIDIVILDTSAACHMPDVLEMPYRPHIIGSKGKGENEYTYRLGGMTCLAGDIIGDYSFEKPLKIGDKLIFTDMAHYTMVKNNTFNGIRLPDIMIYRARENKLEEVKTFGYEDYKRRL